VAREPAHSIVSGGVNPPQERPPQMFDRPAEPPPALERVADLEAVRAFRYEVSAQRQMRGTFWLGSLRTSLRACAGRVSGRADRRLVFAVADATDALVERCQVISDRLGSLEALTSDVTDAFGSELAQLRAEVAHLRVLIASLENRRGA